jgi:hypothetical protein
MASREPGGERKPLDAHHASNGSHPSAVRSRSSRSPLGAGPLVRVSEEEEGGREDPDARGKSRLVVRAIAHLTEAGAARTSILNRLACVRYTAETVALHAGLPEFVLVEMTIDSRRTRR